MPAKEKPKKKQILFGRDHLQNHPHAKWLNTAIRSNRWGKDRNVTITYKKLNGETVQRKVRPLGAKGEHLIAHDHHRDGIRSFHIGRIENMEKTAFGRGFLGAMGRHPIATGTAIGAGTGAGLGAVIPSYDPYTGERRSRLRAALGGAVSGGITGAYIGAEFADAHHRAGPRRGSGGYAPPPQSSGFTRAHAEELGIHRNMPKTKAEAKSIYRDLARKHHPDLGGSAEKMKSVNDAWEKFEKSREFSKLAYIYSLLGRRAG